MITTILIVLVAVVVLIVIIAVLALHFLRADDSDTFDDMPAEPRSAGRSQADAPRDQVSATAERRRSRHPEPVREPPARDPRGAERQLRPVDDRPASYRDRETAPRPGTPDRRSGQPAGVRPVAASARSAKSAKAAGPDAKTSSWDSLSDVDYWAELAADKPQVSPTPSGPAAGSGSARPNGKAHRGGEAKSAGRAASAGRSGPRGDSGPVPAGPMPVGLEPVGSLPVRPRSQPARAGGGAPAGRPADVAQTEQFDMRAARAAGYGTDSASQGMAALARLSGPQPSTPPRPATGPRLGSSPRTGSGPRPSDNQRPGPRPASAPAASGQPAQPAGRARTPVPLDDDPLTSPSFPAINTSDSRSYRARRSSGAHTRPPTGPLPADGRVSGGFAQPTAQYAGPPSPVAQTPPLMPAPQMPAAQAQPVANPYGSYVNAPQPSYQDAAAAHQDVPSYGGNYGQQADGAWHGGAASGYLPAAGYTGGDYLTNGHPGNGHPGNGHNGSGYNGSGYAGGDQQDAVAGGIAYGPDDYQNLPYPGVDYQPAPPVPGGYAPQNQRPGQYDQRGYGTPDLAYGQDGYQGYPGYGAGGRQ